MSNPFQDLSLVPKQIPSSLTQTVISSAGRDGSHGGYGGSPRQGLSAGDLFIDLYYDPDSPNNIQAVNRGHRPKQISPSEDLLLNARGGHGGNGGIGTNGADGYNGADGMDATRSSAGTSGGDGGDGGDAGPGTNGADAGHGGIVLIKLSEDDLDLLLATSWYVKGGTGGVAGRHGIPGRGGSGGRGGSSYSWTEDEIEHYTDEDGKEQSRTVTRHYTNPGGSSGSDGRDGRRPKHKLYAGSDGRDGSASITVERNNGTTTSYASRYHLVVKSFEVFDENNDGVNEPGEYLIVKNIVVHNQGPMPSPSGNLLKVVIRETQWLQPETSAPLNVPNSIPPNQEATIPGQIRAFIRHEKRQRKSGQQLLENETVTLLAYSERLKRAVHEFSGAVPIVIQYPLQLPYPAYINCMTKADQMTMSWIVENISNRGYGHASDTHRAAETRITDLTESFVLESVAGRDNVVVNVIDNSVRKTTSSTSESFTVASDTKVFSTGSWKLELYLSDPHNPEEMREIVNYKFDVQVSEPYEYKENSQFLLVINASTRNESILEMKRLIVSELHLGVDIFNINLVGSLLDDETEMDILFRYKGKSIIISGNIVRFFGPAKRYNWDLIDPQAVLFLAMNHTGFLFSEVLDEKAQISLTEWSRLLDYPVGPDIDTIGTLVEHKNRRTLVQSLRKEPKANTFTLELKNQFVLNKNFRILRRVFQGTTERRLKRTGKTLAKELNYKMPMRRFIVTTTKRLDQSQEPANEPEAGLKEGVEEEPPSFFGKIHKKLGERTDKDQSRKTTPSTGILTVAEGLSRTACCIFSHSPAVDNLNKITPQQVMMMIASLPFRRLSLIFWNIVRSLSGDGVSVEAFYRNLPNLEFSLDSFISDDFGEKGGIVIRYDICAAVAWAVERALDSDVQQLCAMPYTLASDPVSKKDAYVHTDRIAQFFGAIQNENISASEEGIDMAIEVLSSLDTALRCRSSFIEFLRKLPLNSHRRPKLRKSLSKHKKSALLFMAPPDKTQELEERISEATKLLWKELKKDRKVQRVEQSHMKRRLAALNKGSASGYTDFSAGERGSAYLESTSAEAYKIAHQKLLRRQWTDGAHARHVRKTMLVKVYSTVDYIALADFK